MSNENNANYRQKLYAFQHTVSDGELYLTLDKGRFENHYDDSKYIGKNKNYTKKKAIKYYSMYKSR